MANPYINSEFFQRLEAQAFNLKNNLSGFFGGMHRTNKYGQTVEFADYREYQLGDDIRRIDWNLYSRFQHHFIKLFTDERQMHVQIYLDCSASMGREIEKKGQYAVAMAAGLSFLAVHNMDKLSFRLVHEHDIDDSGIIIGKQAFYRKISELENVSFEGDSHLSDTITKGKTTGRDGMAVIISDFLTDNDWKKAVDFLVYQGKQVMLIQILDQSELKPGYTGRFNLVDSESLDIEDSRNLKMRITGSFIDAYDKALEAIQANIKDFASSRGASYVCISTDTPIEKALFNELLKVGVIG